VDRSCRHCHLKPPALSYLSLCFTLFFIFISSFIGFNSGCNDIFVDLTKHQKALLLILPPASSACPTDMSRDYFCLVNTICHWNAIIKRNPNHFNRRVLIFNVSFIRPDSVICSKNIYVCGQISIAWLKPWVSSTCRSSRDNNYVVVTVL